MRGNFLYGPWRQLDYPRSACVNKLIEEVDPAWSKAILTELQEYLAAVMEITSDDQLIEFLETKLSIWPYSKEEATPAVLVHFSTHAAAALNEVAYLEERSTFAKLEPEKMQKVIRATISRLPGDR
jgi:hypothetical protein